MKEIIIAMFCALYSLAKIPGVDSNYMLSDFRYQEPLTAFRPVTTLSKANKHCPAAGREKINNGFISSLAMWLY